MHSILREPFSGISHFIGFIFAIVGLFLLNSIAFSTGTIWHKISYPIYGSTMILLFLASSLYHLLPISEKKLEIFRKIDHIAIFVFIAGSYTPFCLLPLRDTWGWLLLALIWSFVVSGVLIKIFWMNAPRVISVGIYLAMGWSCGIFILPIIRSTPNLGVLWLFISGIFYTIGAVIYVIQRPNPIPKIFGFHEIWHIFVMLGSFSCFWSVFKYLSQVS